MMIIAYDYAFLTLFFGISIISVKKIKNNT